MEVQYIVYEDVTRTAAMIMIVTIMMVVAVGITMLWFDVDRVK